MVDEKIELERDTAAETLTGQPKPLTPPGEVVIEGDGINLKGFHKVDGVYEEDGAFPISGKGESE